MRFEKKYAIAGIAVLLGVLLLFGCINTGSLVPTFLYGATHTLNDTGVYVTSGSNDVGWQDYYALYGFKLRNFTIGGTNVQPIVPLHQIVAGQSYGLYQCKYNPKVYYIVTGKGRPVPDTWKLFELNNPTALVKVEWEWYGKEAVHPSMLSTAEYEICGGGYDIYGQPTGSPINQWNGNVETLTKDFSTPPPSSSTCSDGTQPGACSTKTIGQRCQNNKILVSDASCVTAPTDCLDGTKNGVCSVTTSGTGMRCNNGLLTADGSCGTIPGTTPGTTPVQKDVLTQIGEFVMGVINSVLRLFGLAK